MGVKLTFLFFSISILLAMPMAGNAESAASFTPVSEFSTVSPGNHTCANCGEGTSSPVISSQQSSSSSESSDGGAGTSSKDSNNPTDSKSNGDSTASSSSSYESCMASAQAELTECSSQAAKTASSCNSDSSPSLQSAMTSATQSTTGMNSSSGIVTACSKTGVLLAGAKAALTSFSSNCSSAKNSCVSVCNSAKRSAALCAEQNGIATETISYKEAAENSSQCTAFQAKVDQASGGVASLNSEIEKSKQCEQLLSATNTPSNDPNSLYCKAHPKATSCILNCEHPNMINNSVCVCMKNPTLATCGGERKTVGIIAGKEAATKISEEVKKQEVKKPSNSAEGSGTSASVKLKKSENSSSVSTVSVSSRSSGLNSGSSFPSKENSLEKSGLLARNLYSGAWGAEGGGGKGGSNTSKASGSPQNTNKPSSTEKFKNKSVGIELPDLRQFLPGGKLAPRRGIAGIGGFVGIDGITGSNESNWEKMRRRYNSIEPTLLP